MASAARGRGYESQTAYAWVGAVFGVVLALLAADLVLVLVLEGRHGRHPPADNGLVQRRLDRAGMLFGVRLLVWCGGDAAGKYFTG